MNTAKKASASIVDDEAAVVEKIAEDIHPDRPDAKAMPAYASEQPNGAPSTGPNEELGLTAVVDSTAPPQGSDEMVRMVHADGHEIEVNVADVKIHERSGWKRLNKEEV